MFSVREMQEVDIALIADYWTGSDAAQLQAMGVDLDRMPQRADLTGMLTTQHHTPLESKRSYCIIWEYDGAPIGHCNTNPTSFGREAFMHLHIWNREFRQKGAGTSLLRMTLPLFFGRLKLRNLISEPYALNPAPNRTLERAGFQLTREYITIPGSLNFEQPVKRWELSRERFDQIR